MLFSIYTVVYTVITISAAAGQLGGAEGSPVGISEPAVCNATFPYTTQILATPSAPSASLSPSALSPSAASLLAYTTEYTYACGNGAPATSTPLARESLCASVAGAAFHPATFLTANTLFAFRERLILDGVRERFVAIGAVRSASPPSSSSWEWGYGRLKGRQMTSESGNGASSAGCMPVGVPEPVSEGPTYVPMTGLNCLFAPNQPLPAVGSGDFLGLSGFAADTPPFFMGNSPQQQQQSANATLCVACERSPCAVDLDCVATNTLSASGFFPNCRCECVEGSTGAACEFSTSELLFTVDHGPYTSQFAQICGSDEVTDEGGNGVADVFRERCRAFGDGWDLATFPSEETQLGFLAALAARPALLGSSCVGAHSTTSGAWAWSAGRLAGQTFRSPAGACDPATFASLSNGSAIFQNCLWNASKTSSSIGGSGEAFFEVPSMQMRERPISFPLSCAACERSPCRMGTDCYEPNTVRMVGSYFGSCSCVCKDGAWGDRCEFPLLLEHSHGPYASDYHAVCEPSAGTVDSFKSRCAALGNGTNGWGLATFPTNASLDAYLSLLQRRSGGSLFLDAFIGSDTADGLAWRWSAGRLAGRDFWDGPQLSSGGTCLGVAFDLFNTSWPSMSNCLWGSAYPNTAGGADGIGSLSLGAVPEMHMASQGPTAQLRCAACERSPCRMGTDCYEPNTVSMVGSYFGNCSCVCKAGAWGDRCEYPIIVDHGPYVSHYAAACAPTEGSYAAIRQQCTALGVGWDYATFPSEGSLNAFRWSIAPAHRNNSFYASNSTGAPDSWRWGAGRVAGIAHWQGKAAAAGGQCLTASFSSFDQTVIFKNCLWAATKPDGVGIGGGGGTADVAALWAAGDPFMTMSDVSSGGNGVVACAACERSPCRMGADCYKPNTVSIVGSYFGSCSCVCKDGAWGDRCEYPIVVDHGPYVSHYQPMCDGPNTFAYYNSRCRSLGGGFASEDGGWDLATFPTLAALDAYRRVVGGTANESNSFVGADDAASEGFWMWNSGRLKDELFWSGGAAGKCFGFNFTTFDTMHGFSECIWATPPSNVGGGAGSANWGALRKLSGMRMVDTIASPTLPAELIGCAVCERSPCKMGVDCNEANTVSMDEGGFFPNCRCVCKAGTWGDKCQYPLVYDHGPYVSEYQPMCQATGGTFYTLRDGCKALGDGWDYATLPTERSMRLYRYALSGPNRTNTFIGGDDIHYVVVRNFWRWDSGRLNGEQIWSGAAADNGGACNTIEFVTLAGQSSFFQNCLWTIGNPQPGGGGGLYLPSQGAFPYLHMSHIPATPPAGTSVRCAACERSPCKMGVDCSETNTVNMTGSYFPNCRCECKPGHWGDKCQFPLLYDHGPYTSEYAPMCRATQGNYAQIRTLCTSMGPEWDYATFPTEGSLLLYRQSLTGSNYSGAYIGSDNLVREGLFYWNSGRMKDTVLYDADKCQTINYTRYGNTTLFKNCLWAISEPNHVGGGGKGDVLCLFPGTVPAMFFADIAYAPTWNVEYIYCAACERSPCRLETDCYAPNTNSVSGYYPSCTCECKVGWFGVDCTTSFMSSYDHGPYVSEYQHVCAASPDTYDGHRARCRALGTGFDLATFPTAESLLNYQKILVGSLLQDAFVGAEASAQTSSSSAQSPVWVWNSGRARGRAMWAGASDGYCQTFPFAAFNTTESFRNCLWTAGEPTKALSDSVVSAPGSVIRGILANSLPSKMDMGARASNAQLMCAACERSPCRMGTDCYEPNTVSMVGSYFGSCSCVCKEGAWGDRCEYPVVVEQRPAVVSEYGQICAASSLSHSAASTLCRGALGPEWGLATFLAPCALSDVSSRLRAANNLTNAPWLSLVRGAEGEWVWGAGRLNGTVVNEAGAGTECANTSYFGNAYDPAGLSPIRLCPWHPAQPAAASPPSGSPLCGLLSPQLEMLGAASPCDGSGSIVGVTSPAVPRCALCERSRCSLAADCHPSNTLRVEGTFYPNCSCVCKRLFHGAGCELAETPTRSLPPTPTIDGGATATQSSSMSIVPQATHTASDREETTLTASESKEASPTAPLATTITAALPFTPSDGDGGGGNHSRTVEPTEPRDTESATTAEGSNADATSPADDGNATSPTSGDGGSATNVTSAHTDSTSNPTAPTMISTPDPRPSGAPPNIVDETSRNSSVTDEIVSGAAPELRIMTTDLTIGRSVCSRTESAVLATWLVTPLAFFVRRGPGSGAVYDDSSEAAVEKGGAGLFVVIRSGWFSGGPDAVGSYGDALLANVIFFICTVALGVVSVMGYRIVGAIFWPHEFDGSSSGSRSGERGSGGWFASLTLAASAVSFPGTCVQCIIHLSLGTAVAAGAALGTAAAGGSAEGRNDVALGVVALLLVLASPAVWVGLRLLIAGTDDPFEVAIAPPDEHRKPTHTSTGRVLRCAYVRPSRTADRLGPLVADLSFHTRFSPTLPAVLPFALVIVSFVVTAAGAGCGVLPLVLGIVFALYAACVAAFRPLLGLSHLAAEVLCAFAAAVCCVGWGVVGLTRSSSSSTEVTPFVYLLLALSSSRYPFIVARLLDVVAPRVVFVDKALTDADNDAEADDVLSAPLVVPTVSYDDGGAVGEGAAEADGYASGEVPDADGEESGDSAPSNGDEDEFEI